MTLRLDELLNYSVQMMNKLHVSELWVEQIRITMDQMRTSLSCPYLFCRDQQQLTLLFNSSVSIVGISSPFLQATDF